MVPILAIRKKNSWPLKPPARLGMRPSARIWRTACVPPLPALTVLGEPAQAAAEGRSDFGLEEAAMLLASRFVEAVSEHDRLATLSLG